MNFEELEVITAQHTYRHFASLPLNRDYSCYYCYPPPALNTCSIAFQNFWTWFNYEYRADTYTAYTVAAFKVFEDLYPIESEYRDSRLGPLSLKF